MNFHRAILAAGLALLAGPSLAQQYPTIVGEWYGEAYGPQDCGTPMAIHIGPKSWVEDSYVCTFNDVARSGWKVTWNGTCSDGSNSERMRLIAVETNGRLTTNWNGNTGDFTLRRCTAR